MNPAPELAPQLKSLRLSGILDSLSARNRQAIESKLAYTEFLALLIGDEVARRDLVGVNYPGRPATTILAGGGGEFVDGLRVLAVVS